MKLLPQYTFIFCAIAFLALACGGLSSQQKAAASEAITALRKLEAASQVNTTSYPQYSQLVVEAKARVNQAATVLPDGELKNELKAAMDAYADAATAWAGMQNNAYLRADREPGKTLGPKYNLDLSGTGMGAREYADSLERMSNPNYESPMVRVWLGKIWAVGKSHLDRASALI